MNMPVKYLYMSGLQKKLGRSRSAIYKDIAAGRIPEPLRFGSKLMWRERDVDEHIQRLFEDQAREKQRA